MKAVRKSLVIVILTAGAPILLNAIELQPGTLQAWDDYISAADSRMQARLDAERPFLWTDEAPDRKSRLQRGEVLVAPVSRHGTQSVPNGLIHDWIGAVFIPNTTLDRLLAVVHDYDRYKEFYKPAVTDSKVLACADRDQSFSMVWQSRVLFVNAAIEGQYQAHDFAVDERRGYTITATTSVQEVEGYGHSGEHLLPPGQGNGFIWRLHSIVRYEERDGGLYLEIEAIALTRDIPASLRWVVKPVVNHLSTASLAASLRQTRDAVNSVAGQPDRLGLCAGGGRKSAKATAGGGN
jgi:hypothetical protein